ncbi:NADH dehydrogenase [ubiquinone] 1 subunit C2 [Achroia grisella]|uniref:NADH dehydrogenase [ubiquinone] 1 subunit C2 n=1 Tax=Achroia grisella TaxID=688607 RepID=UPI0027D26693|nr:NADH dehydrogenase [ubiquinone] 1 subunit C2 [Achroia grisella]XP_059049635.1 NADH dehydrogenase [ubiquinone] 1 subunit C2 [Achroia grisella]
MSSQMSAIELLKLGNEGRQKPFLNAYWPQILGVAFGVGAAVSINFGTRRPLFSGIQKHVLLAGATTALLTYVQKKRDEYYAERDAVYRHYIELHPEDFPVPERRKIGDLLEPWVPIR